jgi:hypothetical protein
MHRSKLWLCGGPRYNTDASASTEKLCRSMTSRFDNFVLVGNLTWWISIADPTFFTNNPSSRMVLFRSFIIAVASIIDGIISASGELYLTTYRYHSRRSSRLRKERKKMQPYEWVLGESAMVISLRCAPRFSKFKFEIWNIRVPVLGISRRHASEDRILALYVEWRNFGYRQTVLSCRSAPILS